MLQNGLEYSLEANKHLSNPNIQWDQMESPNNILAETYILEKSLKYPNWPI